MTNPAIYSDSAGTYVISLTKSEWEEERAKADEVHIVQHERSGSVE